MLYIISGPSSVGKSIIVDRFIKMNNFKRVVPYTSRKLRQHEHETNGVEYFFRTKKELLRISNNFNNGYWDFPFNNTYGYTKDIEQAIISDDNYIILATTKIALSIKRDFPSVVISFIDFETNAELIRRITCRFKPNKKFIKEKLLNAEKEREYKGLYDIQLKSDDPNLLYEQLEKLIIT
jgi:guanylate kinase